ncbi:MAG: chemotaxis protein CheX [Deltaproteobacteria bacterium]|nr:chemotaxis protein CheX [Deltaproteobacteria bacterium]
MINDDTRQKLNEAAVAVFGSMYFTPIELLPDIPPEDKWHLQDKYVRAAIAYSGPHSAKMTLYFPEKLGANIAAGFLGRDIDQLSAEQIIDTMREAANMIVGSFLGKLDPHGACKLEIPVAEIVASFSPVASAPVDSAALAFMSDFGFMWIFVSN